MPFQLSPGVAVVEKDFSSIVPAVSSSVGAFAGSFSWGPVMQPVTVSSENVLVKQFGGPNDSNFQSFFSAANFLSYANNLLLVRADSTLSKNAVAVPTGGLSGLVITNAGTGYSSTSAAPSVTVSAPQITGGVQAVVSVTLTGGAITAVAISNGGSGYVTAPTVSIVSSGGGSGATFTVGLTAGAVTSVTVDNGGSGYKGTVTASFTTGNAIAGAVTVASSSIATATIVTAGSGYSSVPTVTVANPPSGTLAVLTPTLASAGVKIKNSENYLDTYANGAGVVGEFAAKYPGTQGNSISVAYCDSSTWSTWEYKAEFDSAPSTSTYAASVGGTNDEIHLVITDRTGVWTGTPGTVLEKFPFVSKASDAKKPDGTGNHYRNVVNTLSSYVWWMDYPQTNTDWGTTAVSKAFSNMISTGDYDLSGGVDDFTMTDGQQQSAYQLFANAELYDVSLLIAGKASSTNAAYIADIAQSRADCVAFVSPVNAVTGEVIIGNTSTETAAIIAFRNAMNTIHSYAVMDSGFKYQYDRYNDKYRYVTLNADTAGLCARTDYTNDPWWSPGGYNRGQIKNVVRLAHNPDKTSRDLLYKAGINPVVSFPGQGVVLYGDKTMQTKPSAFDRINVRRLFIVVEKAIATAAKFQLFEFNDSFTRAQFKNLVEPFLRDVQGRRGIVDFRVKCDDTNNTGEVIDRNEFIADIFIKPNRSINYITLNFVAARSSANFTEIGG